MTFTNAGKITAESHFHFIYSFLVTEKQIQVFFLRQKEDGNVASPLSLMLTGKRTQYQSNLIRQMYLFPNFWFDSHIHLGKRSWEASHKPTCKMTGQTLVYHTQSHPVKNHKYFGIKLIKKMSESWLIMQSSSRWLIHVGYAKYASKYTNMMTVPAANFWI